MQKFLNNIKILLFLALIILAALQIATYLNGHKETERQAPISIPFDAGLVGAPKEMEVTVEERQVYAVGLRFHFTERAGEAARVGKMLGMATKDEAGNWTEAGVPATFHVRINKLAGGNVLLDVVTEHPKTSAGYKSRYAHLATIFLEPGRYLVSVEGIRSSTELSSLDTRLYFAVAHHGK